MTLTRHVGLKRSASKARNAPMGSTARKQTDRKPGTARKGTRRHVIPTNVREAVIRRSGRRCEAPFHYGCMGIAQHIHHRQLLSAGGTDHPSNLLHVSLSCHRGIHDHPADSYANGALVSRYGEHVRAITGPYEVMKR